VIYTQLSPTLPATLIHRATGEIDLQQAENGAHEALQQVEDYAAQQGPLNLLLNLRDIRFQNMQAHRAWSLGFARNPTLQNFVQRVAILASDSPNSRAEQAMLGTDRLQFFFDLAACEQWLTA